MIIKTERRTSPDRRQVADPFAPERPSGDRRTMCWEVENCTLTIRYRCPAFILRRPCWELWAVDGVGPARACCHNEIDCEPGRCAIAEKRFAGGDVPCPPTWGGYVVRPERVEFWQGRRGRMHDRLRYRRDGEGWVVERLAP